MSITAPELVGIVWARYAPRPTRSHLARRTAAHPLTTRRDVIKAIRMVHARFAPPAPGRVSPRVVRDHHRGELVEGAPGGQGGPGERPRRLF